MAPELQKVIDRYIVRQHLEKYASGGEFEVKVGLYNISQITGASCLYKVLLSRRKIMQDMAEGVTHRQVAMLKEELPGLREALRGTIIHEKLQETYLAELPGRVIIVDERVNYPVESTLLPGEKFTLTGKFDIYDVTDNIIIELKSVKHMGFIGWQTRGGVVPGVQNVPHDFHLMQGNAYAILNNVPRYEVAYIDAEEFVTAEHVRNVSVEMFATLVHNADLLFYSEKTGKVHPEIESATVEAWKCKRCPLTGECELE